MYSLLSLFKNWRRSCFVAGFAFCRSRRILVGRLSFLCWRMSGRERGRERGEGRAKEREACLAISPWYLGVASSFLFERVRVFLLTRHPVTVLLFFSSTLPPRPPSLNSTAAASQCRELASSFRLIQYFCIQCWRWRWRRFDNHQCICRPNIPGRCTEIPRSF